MDKKILPPAAVRRFFFLALVVAAVSNFHAAGKTVPATLPAANAVHEVHYDRLMRAEEFKTYDRAAVHQIQQDLAQIYHDDSDFLRDVALGHKPLTDDIIGPVTLFWMQRFCYTFKIEPIGDYTETLVHAISGFAAFGTRHGVEKDIILTRDFNAWVENLPAAKKATAYDVRRSGSDAARLGLVDEYLKRPSKKTAGQADPQIYSYRLDDVDIADLRSKSAILAGLADFPAKPYADAAEFDVAVTAALKDLPPEIVKGALPTIESAAKVGGYRVTGMSIQRMSDLGVPDDLVQTLESLQGVLYVDATELDAAMEAAAANADLDVDFAKYRAKIASVSELGTYSLDQDALKKLGAALSDNNQKPIVPIALLDILTQLEGVNYPTADLFNKAAQAKVWYSLGACPTNTPDYAKYVRSLAMKDDAFGTFAAAISSSLGGSDAKAVAEMNARFDALKPSRNMTGVCTSKDTDSGQELVADIYRYYQATLSGMARKAPLASNKAISWSGGAWGFKDGAIVSSCGCLLNDLTGQVYAFYPFWLEPPKAPGVPGDDKTPNAGGKESGANPPQVIDFNVTSRIGFVGFTFDDKGNLKPVPGRENANYDFAKVAQGFQTRIDWVIRRDDWTTWNALSIDEQRARFAILRADIVNLMQKSGGNGITLFFDDYPSFDSTVHDNTAVIGVFDEFVDGLGRDLRNANKDYGLNIVLRQPQLLRDDTTAHATAKAIDYVHMLKLLTMLNPQDNRKAVWISGNQTIDKAYSLVVSQPTPQTRNHILLLLEEPTTDSKKRLRLEIEQALHGEERHTLLSGVIPVIEFDGRNWEQLEDDIIYFKDNFDGIGFWPVNFHQASQKVASDKAAQTESHCDTGETVEECLVKTYQGYHLNGRDDTVLDKFVCQFHMWFRLLFGLQLALFLITYLVPIFTCYLADWKNRHFMLLAANLVLMGVIGAMLFAWDPAVEGGRAHVVIIFILLVLMGVEALRRRREFIARTVKPSRAKSAMLEKLGRSIAVATESDQRAQREVHAQTLALQRHNRVLKAVLRLRTFVEDGRPAAQDQISGLRTDLGILQDYLDIQEQEAATTRVKIKKAAQVVMGNLEMQHETAISSQKMRRLAILLWSYFNGNIDAERRVLHALEPFLELFEEGKVLQSGDRLRFGIVLQDAHHCIEEREETETEVFDAMRQSIDLMNRYLSGDATAVTSLASTMQVVWAYADHDEALHGRRQIEGEQSKGPLIEMANSPPIVP